MQRKDARTKKHVFGEMRRPFFLNHHLKRHQFLTTTAQLDQLSVCIVLLLPAQQCSDVL